MDERRKKAPEATVGADRTWSRVISTVAGEFVREPLGMRLDHRQHVVRLHSRWLGRAAAVQDDGLQLPSAVRRPRGALRSGRTLKMALT
jgi:hypothetical protein